MAFHESGLMAEERLNKESYVDFTQIMENLY